MSALERPMVAVVAPDDELRALLASDQPVPFGLRLPETPESACREAPSEHLRAQIAAGDPRRTEITACLLPKGHADDARYGRAVHVGLVDVPTSHVAFRFYQWVVL